MSPLKLALGGLSTFGLSYYVLSHQGELALTQSAPFRFGRAAITVASIGLDYRRTLYRDASVLESMSEAERTETKSSLHTRSALKLLELCRINGGCFVKVGQHIGALDYLLPDEYVRTLRVLHHRAPEMSLEDVQHVLEEELRCDPHTLFTSFDPKPLGTASLAQVHKAVLRESGEVVAVKVQHRDVKSHARVDTYTMHFLLSCVKFFFPRFEFMWLADEMRKNLPKELDFTEEAENAECISKLLRDFQWLKVPRIHRKLCTQRVIVMEFCEGDHISNVEALRSKGFDMHDITGKLGRMYAEMIFNVGYVHCDPHPGNVLVDKNDDGKARIVLLDHGLYSSLSTEFRRDYSNFWLKILQSDVDGIKTYADRLGVGQLYGLFACMVSGRSWNSILKGIDKNKKNKDESEEIKRNAARYLPEITNVLAYVNRQMLLIFKTNDLLRGIEHSLGVEHSMSAFVQMSRACFRTLNEERRELCSTTWCRFRVGLQARFDQLAISVYQVMLWLYWTPLGQWWLSIGSRKEVESVLDVGVHNQVSSDA